VAREVGLSPVSVPDSTVSLLPAQLVDLFSAPDWHPADHPVMPDVVARGRSPSYIVRQLFDIQSGLRAGSQVAPMAEIAKRLRTEEMAQIAAYLATLHRAASG
jgi:hypothetical protein